MNTPSFAGAAVETELDRPDDDHRTSVGAARPEPARDSAHGEDEQPRPGAAPEDDSAAQR